MHLTKPCSAAVSTIGDSRFHQRFCTRQTGWFLSIDQIALPHSRSYRRGLHGGSNNEPARFVLALVGLLVEAMNSGSQFLRNASVANLFHHADDVVPVGVRAELAKLEPSAKR